MTSKSNNYNISSGTNYTIQMLKNNVNNTLHNFENKLQYYNNIHDQNSTNNYNVHINSRINRFNNRRRSRSSPSRCSPDYKEKDIIYRTNSLPNRNNSKNINPSKKYSNIKKSHQSYDSYESVIKSNYENTYLDKLNLLLDQIKILNSNTSNINFKIDNINIRILSIENYIISKK